MGISTPTRRAGAIHVGLPWRGMLPYPGIPSTDINADDRAQTASFYPAFSHRITSTAIIHKPVDYVLAGSQIKKARLAGNALRHAFNE